MMHVHYVSESTSRFCQFLEHQAHNEFADLIKFSSAVFATVLTRIVFDIIVEIYLEWISTTAIFRSITLIRACKTHQPTRPPYSIFAFGSNFSFFFCNYLAVLNITIVRNTIKMAILSLFCLPLACHRMNEIRSRLLKLYEYHLGNN